MNRCNPDSVRAVLLAGVHGWGESPLDSVCSRPLLPLLGRPVFRYVLDWLRRDGVREASVCANSQTRIFRRCLGDGAHAGMAVTYYEDLMPRGPAGCMRDAGLNSDAETFLLTESSIVPKFSVAQLLETHDSSGAALTAVVCTRESAPGRPEELEPVGIYVASRAVIEQIAPTGYQDLKEIWLTRLHDRGFPVLGYRVPRDSVLRISNMQSYLAAAGTLLEGVTDPPGGFCRVGSGIVHASARLDAGTRIAGPVLIGPDTHIGRDATLIGPAVIGAGCNIEPEAVISCSSLWCRVNVSAGAVVDRCILPAGSHVPSGSLIRETVWMPEGARHVSFEELYWALTRETPAWPADVAGSSVALSKQANRSRQRHRLEQDEIDHPEPEHAGFRRKHVTTPD